jgi:phosphoribosylamine--glycine ligase
LDVRLDAQCLGLEESSARMRFLGVSETCDLGSLYRRLIAEGHEVRLFVEEELAQGTLAGMVERTRDWRAELDWVREAGPDGIILFEAVSEGLGELQDQLRREGLNVIGGSAVGDRLENDRAFAQQLLSDLGFPGGHVREFDDSEAALDYLAARPRRYVLKFSGPDHSSSDNYIGQRDDGSDVAAMLRARLGEGGPSPRFILMDFIEGVEMGVGAYFDGDKFLTPACLDWEHKRFFAGDMGELTGEMGTVATFQRSDSFFERTLKLLEPRLRAAGHVGYVNLNTIVNEQGIWPLEFTSRFGYPGYSVLEPLQAIGWGALFRSMIARDRGQMPVHPGFSVGILLTTPPFPYSRKQVDEPVGLPVLIDHALGDGDFLHLHFGEIGLADGQLVTSGLYGWTLVVTGVKSNIAAAQEAAYDRLRHVFVPNMRYRLDIGSRLLAGDWERLERLGLLDDA